jgi:hypothetical protein
MLQLVLGRPDKAGAKIDNNCCRADLSREHVGSLLLDQWVKDKHVKGLSLGYVNQR